MINCAKAEDQFKTFEAVVTPQMFGPIGDDPDANRETIQRMADQTPDCCHIHFPQGEYLVAPASPTDVIIEFYQRNLHVTFDKCACIKIADGSGNYEAIFGPRSDSYDIPIECWEFYDTCFDHNYQNNTVATPNTPGRYSITTFRMRQTAHRIYVQNADVFNNDSVVSMYFPSPAATLNLGSNEYVGVVESDFHVGTNAGELDGDYDQSTINVAAERIEVRHNRLVGDSWERAPRTAIETHGSNHAVHDNFISKYQVGMNITGIRNDGVISEGVNAHDNIIEVGRAAIYIWTTAIGGIVGDWAIEDVKVVDNQIRHRWSQLTNGRPGLTGIGIFGGSNALGIRNLDIQDNQLTYSAEIPNAPALDRTGQPTSDNAIQIRGSSTFPVKIESLNIDGNHVKDAPCAWLGSDFVEINCGVAWNNKIHKCGTASTAVSTAYQNQVNMQASVTERFTYRDNDHCISIPNQDLMYIRNRSGTGVYRSHRNEKSGVGDSGVTVFTGTTLVTDTNTQPWLF